MLALQVKHGGVLGLSSLILAFPYDVCSWMPEVVIHLGNYVHEVPQIAVSWYAIWCVSNFNLKQFYFKSIFSNSS